MYPVWGKLLDAEDLEKFHKNQKMMLTIKTECKLRHRPEPTSRDPRETLL